ncbi:hypothetical protein NC652_029237 [Populus alba x Populus x berolinensis]|nr:hypothetical protein NC652_029237 [Populus alba x Populus x berolinensis]
MGVRNCSCSRIALDVSLRNKRCIQILNSSSIRMRVRVHEMVNHSGLIIPPKPNVVFLISNHRADRNLVQVSSFSSKSSVHDITPYLFRRETSDLDCLLDKMQQPWFHVYKYCAVLQCGYFFT